MGDSSQEATTLSQYHWLFSDDSSEPSDIESGYTPMLPRVLTYEEPFSTPASCADNVLAIASDEPHFEQFLPSQGLFEAYKPALRSHSSGDPFEMPPDAGARSCAHAFFDGLQPALQPGLKRQRETGYEEDSRCNKHLRSSSGSSVELLPDLHLTFPSPIISNASSISPLFYMNGDSIRENPLSWWENSEVQNLKVQLATAEVQAAANSSLLSDTRACLITLMTELRRIIASASRQDNADNICRVISAVDHRVNSYLETFPMMNEVVSSSIEVPTTSLVHGFAQSTAPFFHPIGTLNSGVHPRKPQPGLAVTEVDYPRNITHADYAVCSPTQLGCYDAFASVPMDDVPSLSVDPIPGVNWLPLSPMSRHSLLNSSSHPNRKPDTQTIFYQQKRDDQFEFGADFSHQLSFNAAAQTSSPSIAHLHQSAADPLLWPTLPLVNPPNRV